MSSRSPTSTTSRPERLRASADFARVQAKGRRVRGGLLVVVHVPRSEGTRVGFTVSRKVGKAVVRNRVKRWLREVERRVPLPSADLVLIALPSAADAGFAALLSEVTELVRRVRR